MEDELDERASLLGSSLGNKQLRQAKAAEPQPVLDRSGNEKSKLSNMTNNFVMGSNKASDDEEGAD